MYIIRDAKGVLFNKRYTTVEEAQRVIDNRARTSEYARLYWYVEEIEDDAIHKFNIS